MTSSRTRLVTLIICIAILLICAVALTQADEQQAIAPDTQATTVEEQPAAEQIKEGASMDAQQPEAAQPEAVEDGKLPIPAPRSHKGNWIKFHGAEVGLSFNEAGQQGSGCYACHDRNDCIDCHSTTPPRDHTSMWRMRGHGMEATGNKERCLRCHRQDFCVACHNETAPRTHTGVWYDEHCKWCHFTSGYRPSDSCSVCHHIAPHSSAPHAVSPSLDCQSCHN